MIMPRNDIKMIANTPLIFDKSNNGCLGYKVSNSTVPDIDLELVQYLHFLANIVPLVS